MKLFPDILRVETGDKEWIQLYPENQQQWKIKDILIELEKAHKGFKVKVASPSIPLSRIQLSWGKVFPPETKFLGDAFERSYGDLGFEMTQPDRIMPWYFIAVHDKLTECYGVMTDPNALSSWQVNDQAIDLWLDIRNGTSPLQLGSRVLDAVTVVYDHTDTLEPFEATTAFCETMCPTPNLPREPIYGGNDWYYAYGNNSEGLILEHTRLISDLSHSNAVLPFMVIDDGWQVDHSSSYNGGPWHESNQKFGSMKELAQQIKQMNVRPGIWFRPLLTHTVENPEHILHSQPDKCEYILDISHPDVLRKVSEDIDRIVGWGYELIKHDFSTVDIFGQWGSEMNLQYTNKVINFYDKTQTTAEIIKAFYKTIKEKSQGAYIIGCNTVSHLAAGVFEIQRTGDDTSGREFSRTRKMGINTLAYRMPQHNTFYSADADCVGITTEIPWHQNVQWLQVLSNSGTPLFISCNPKELTEEMRSDLKKAFELASQYQNSAVPVDWLSNSYPSLWKSDQGLVRYEWYSSPRSFE